MTLNSHTKFEEKLACGLENDRRNLPNFYQNTWKCQNWYGILLSKVAHAWATNYRGVISNDTEEWWEIWRGTDLSFQNWHKEFDEFWLENFKVSRIYPLMGCFWPKYIMVELKKYRELSFMTLECDAKFEEKLTCGLKNGMRNLAIFHQSTQNSQNSDFHWILLYKVENVWA